MRRPWAVPLFALFLFGLIVTSNKLDKIVGNSFLPPTKQQTMQTTVGTCVPRQVWAGSETTQQHNGATLVQIPVTQAVSLQRFIVDNGYAQLSGANYAEELLLVGVSHKPLTIGSDLVPNTDPDPAFGPLNVRTTGQTGHNENPTLNSGVIESRIIKSTNGSQHVTADRSFSPSVQLVSGDVLWIYYASVSASAIDPEIQVVLTVSDPNC